MIFTNMIKYAVDSLQNSKHCTDAITFISTHKSYHQSEPNILIYDMYDYVRTLQIF